MKLHLGCGKKILPGYVNCDYSPCFGGRPDVLFNLLDPWPFDDEVADEVLAVHVWEHFYEWQHPHLVAEALRVLKPGGVLVLEMPDLKKACANFLRNPDDVQNGYWGIYADPNAAGEAEHQMHHSGWWPEKLVNFLVDLGFHSATAMNPQHKGKRIRRDMRVEAIKC